MTLISTTIPALGELNTQADPEIRNALTAIVNTVNGLLDGSNVTDRSLSEEELTTGLMDRAGISQSGIVRRGAVNIPTSESTSSTVYTTLTTADRVQNVVLPTNGLIVVGYSALWQNTVSNNGRAAIFIGANQLKVFPSAALGGAPIVQEAVGISGVNLDDALFTGGFGGPNADLGLTSKRQSGSVTGSATDVTTGMPVQPIYIFAAAGTYDVSIQFKNSAAGTLTVKNRHLWVSTIGF